MLTKIIFQIIKKVNFKKKLRFRQQHKYIASKQSIKKPFTNP